MTMKSLHQPTAEQEGWTALHTTARQIVDDLRRTKSGRRAVAIVERWLATVISEVQEAAIPREVLPREPVKILVKWSDGCESIYSPGDEDMQGHIDVEAGLGVAAEVIPLYTADAWLAEDEGARGAR